MLVRPPPSPHTPLPPPESIQVLFGVDVTRKLLTGRREMLAFQLVALGTHLGWTLKGK